MTWYDMWFKIESSRRFRRVSLNKPFCKDKTCLSHGTLLITVQTHTQKKKENIDPSSTLTILINITNVTTGPPGASVRASPAPKFWFASTAPLPRKVAPDSSALPGGYLKEAGGFSSDPPWKMGKIPWKIHDRSKLPGIYPQNLMVFAIQTRFWILECYITRKNRIWTSLQAETLIPWSFLAATIEELVSWNACLVICWVCCFLNDVLHMMLCLFWMWKSTAKPKSWPKATM